MRMMQQLIRIGGVTLISSLLMSGIAQADVKIGYVDIQRVFDNAPVAVKAKKKLESDFAKREANLQKLAKQIKTQQDALEQNAASLSESERRTRERDLAELTRDFQRKQREYREDFEIRSNEANAAIFERAAKVLKQVAEAEKYDLIVQDAAYFNPRIDITDKIIKALADDGKLPN